MFGSLILRPPVSSYTTVYPAWDASDHSAGIGITGSNYIATRNASDGGARTTLAVPASTKVYTEVYVNTFTTQIGISLCLSTAALGGGLVGVADHYGMLWTNTLRYWTSNGTFSSAADATIAAGQAMQFAIDRANNKLWIGKNNTWYDSANGTTGNPSAGTNATFTLPASTLHMYIWLAGAGCQGTLESSPPTYTPPTGFSVQ